MALPYAEPGEYLQEYGEGGLPQPLQGMVGDYLEPYRIYWSILEEKGGPPEVPQDKLAQVLDYFLRTGHIELADDIWSRLPTDYDFLQLFMKTAQDNYPTLIEYMLDPTKLPSLIRSF